MVLGIIENSSSQTPEVAGFKGEPLTSKDEDDITDTLPLGPPTGVFLGLVTTVDRFHRK
jgi:hypothetical protein